MEGKEGWRLKVGRMKGNDIGIVKGARFPASAETLASLGLRSPIKIIAGLPEGLRSATSTPESTWNPKKLFIG